MSWAHKLSRGNVPHLMRRAISTTAAAAMAVGAITLAATPASADEVTINVLGINDFHGRIDANTVAFAGTVETLRAEAPAGSTLFISNGDNIGGSLFASAVAGDEPTIEVLNALDLDASSVGNHEFDRGVDDLLGRVSSLAEFPYLAANVTDADGLILPAYEVLDVNGVSVAVVGGVTEETPALVSPLGIQGIQFGNLVDSVNDAVAELQALPDAPDVIIATLHEGAPNGSASYEQSIAESVVFRDIVEQVDPAVAAIFTGHTHQTYVYESPIPGGSGETRPVIQGNSYGSLVSQVELTFDTDSGEVVASSASNVPRLAPAEGQSAAEFNEELIAQFPRVAEVADITEAALENAAAIGDQPVAEITADITTAFIGEDRDDRASESTLGNLVADALLSAVSETPAGADIALVNPGGLRADLWFEGEDDINADGVLTYAEANSVLPFTNTLTSTEVSGATLKLILEQQWQRDSAGEVPSRPYLQLGVSENLSYTYDESLPEGDRITGIIVNGARVVDSDTFKIASFSFLAAGGDNFRAFTDGTTVDTGLLDYEAWISYLETNSPVAPDYGRRSVQVVGLESGYNAGEDISFAIPLLDLTSLGGPGTTEATVEYHDEFGNVVEFGSYPVTEGGLSLTLPIPDDLPTAQALLLISASPSGTTVVTPEFAVVGIDPTEPGEPTSPTPEPTDVPTEPAPTTGAPVDGDLPATGSSTSPLIVLASVLAVMLGAILLALRRSMSLQ